MPEHKVNVPISGGFLVVPDTNTLHTKVVGEIVSGGFTKLWLQYRSIATLRLYVPEVVREELIFQQVHTARLSRENATKSLATIAQVTNTRPLKMRSDRDITNRVRNEFRKWAEKHSVRVVSTPITRIKWKQLIHAAAWRLAPFELIDKDNRMAEKGFRDALILETLCDICRTSGDSTVVFLTNDNRLNEGYEERIQKTEKRLRFDSLKAFGSYLTVLKENANRALTQKLLINARQRFYAAGDPTCVYNAFNISGKITSEFAFQLRFPPEKAVTSRLSTLSPALHGATPLFTYNPVLEEKIYLGDTYADKVDADRWIWRTRVTLVRLFTASLTTPASGYSTINEKSG